MKLVSDISPPYTLYLSEDHFDGWWAVMSDSFST